MKKWIFFIIVPLIPIRVMPDVEIKIGNEMVEPSTDPVINTAIQWIITRCN